MSIWKILLKNEFLIETKDPILKEMWMEANLHNNKVRFRWSQKYSLLQINDSQTIRNFALRSIVSTKSKDNNFTYRVELSEANKTITSSQFINIKRHSPIPESAMSQTQQSEVTVESPMNGKVVRILHKQGANIDESTAVLVIEAMKMENSIQTPIGGSLLKVFVNEGDQVSLNQNLFTVKNKEK